MSLPGAARKLRVPLMVPSYGDAEVADVVSVLKSGNVTMGEKVKRFEESWAEYVGTKYALMVNSGSSANLLAHFVIADRASRHRVLPGDEVITPAVTWATTVFPIFNIGARPVFVDVDVETMNMDPTQLRRALSKKTRALTIVHLLGNPCEMDEIGAFAEEHDLPIIEDACNAHGAEYGGKMCGSFGAMGTFSFYFSHIISTIEGGMLVTDSEEHYELAKALRNFGWIRGLKSERSYTADYPFIDKRFLFAHVGFNFRPTEVQGAIGTRQLRRLPRYLRIRKANAEYWLEELSRFERFFILPKPNARGNHVWHHFPLTLRPTAPFTRAQLVSFLESMGVETRPISAGNITEQPALAGLKFRTVGRLVNSRLIMRNSLEWGNHQGIGQKEREYVVDCIGEFVSRHT